MAQFHIIFLILNLLCTVSCGDVSHFTDRSPDVLTQISLWDTQIIYENKGLDLSEYIRTYVYSLYIMQIFTSNVYPTGGEAQDIPT